MACGVWHGVGQGSVSTFHLPVRFGSLFFCYWLFLSTVLWEDAWYDYIFPELSKIFFDLKSFLKCSPCIWQNECSVPVWKKKKKKKKLVSLSQFHLFCDFRDAVSFLKYLLSGVLLIPGAAYCYCYQSFPATCPVNVLDCQMACWWEHAIYHCA